MSESETDALLSTPASDNAANLTHSSHTLSLPDFTMAYDLHGDPNSKQKVLMIMGLLTDGAAWHFQVEHLIRKGYQCVTFDNRGVAKSSTPGVLSYTTRQMARDAIMLVNHLNWNEFHVVGISMGGMIALELTLQLLSSKRISSLALMVTHAGGWHALAPWEGVKTMVTSIFSKDESTRLNALMTMLYTKNSLKDKELTDRLKQHHLERMARRIPPKLAAVVGHTFAVYRHFISYPNLLRIRYAPFPTIVFVGEEDKLVRMSNSHMLSKVLGAKLVVVQDGGHGFLAERPDIINTNLQQHFEHAALHLAKEGSEDDEGDVDNVAQGDYSVESGEALGEGGEVDPTSTPGTVSGAAFSLEEKALQLACSHSMHCSLHNLGGFLTGFVPAFVFRYVFYDSIAVAATPSISRVEQSLRFGLLIGIMRGTFRAIKCIVQSYRARQYVLKHDLRQRAADAVEKNAGAASSASSSAPAPAAARAGIPHGAGFEFPTHSVVLLGIFILTVWQKQLLHGII